MRLLAEFFTLESILAGLIIDLIQFIFWKGDYALIFFFNRHKEFKTYAFDDQKEKWSYYLKIVLNPNFLGKLQNLLLHIPVTFRKK